MNEVEEQQLDTLSGRLVYALESTGMRKAELARAINVKPQVIQFLCNSETKSSRFSFEIATALGLNTRWLATGEGEMFMDDDPKQIFLRTHQQISLLSMQQVIELASGKSYTKNLATNWVALKSDESDMFAMRMPDMSMSPTVPMQATLFIDQSKKTELEDDTIVAAYLTKFSTVIIRQIKTENGKQHLYPANTDLFNPIELTKDALILGTVVECHWSLRR
jgi:SOS-response transcriptional repressor LexA